MAATECPSSTEQGCRCWQHCPGPLAAQTTPAPTLRIITPSSTTAAAEQQQDLLDSLLTESRARCTACQGDAEQCRRGTDHPSYRRLPNCAAWDQDGLPQALKATAQPRQPWEPRQPRSAA
jgi:hypothetical protein